MPTLETIYKNINSGATYGQNVRGCAGNVYYAALSVSDDGRYINYSHYGSSAVANTPEELCWILETIFRKTPEEFSAAYVLEPCGRWIELDDAAKFDALKAACSAACALKPANVRAAGGCKPVELVGDAWIRLETRLQSGDPRPLRDQLLFAALDALRHEARENTHSIGGSAADPADGAADIGPAEKAHNARMRGAAARPIEDAGEIRDAINAAAGDDIDAAIIRGAAAGYTTDDIGAVIGMSGQAVRKRLSAIRARIAAYRDGAGAAMPLTPMRRQNDAERPYKRIQRQQQPGAHAAGCFYIIGARCGACVPQLCRIYVRSMPPPPASSARDPGATARRFSSVSSSFFFFACFFFLLVII